MDGALTVKSINYGKVNLHIKKSDGDINQPTITTKYFPYMGKKTYYPYPTFRVNYKGILPSLKPLKQEVVAETNTHYTPTYGKSSCALTYKDLQNLTIQVSLNENFKVKIDEIFFSYVFLNGQPYQTYIDEKGFEAYISQINFAMHCSTTACGISSEHLLAENNMLRSIYQFHAIFQIRKILNSLGVQLPYVDDFNPFKNQYSMESYRKLCYDFNIHPPSDWRYKYDEKRFIQDGKTGHYVIANTAIGWIQDHSFGLSKVGVQKLSESVRAYVFLILSSQSSARSSIIGKDGRALDAQKIWQSSFEQLVKSNFGIANEIQRYQNVLNYASSKVDFNIGKGVYMLPSNMILSMRNKTGFNNKILVSDQGFKIGVNRLINKTAPKVTHKVAPKVIEKPLPHGERVFSREHNDEMIAVSVLLISTSIIFFYFFK